MKILITSGAAADAGKTTLSDNLFAINLPGLTRFEIDQHSTGSAKPGVSRLRPNQLKEITTGMDLLGDDEHVLVDIGASEYNNFLREVASEPGFLPSFDHYVYVVSPGSKLNDISKHLKVLAEAGAITRKVIVIVNRWSVEYTVELMRETMARQMEPLLTTLRKVGATVISTPIAECPPLFEYLLQSPEHNIVSLAAEPSPIPEMKAILARGEEIPEAMLHKRIAQNLSTGIAKKTLDLVWGEFVQLSASQQDAIATAELPEARARSSQAVQAPEPTGGGAVAQAALGEAVAREPDHVDVA